MKKVRKMYGVTWDKPINMWKARIKQNGTEQFFGYFAKKSLLYHSTGGKIKS